MVYNAYITVNEHTCGGDLQELKRYMLAAGFSVNETKAADNNTTITITFESKELDAKRTRRAGRHAKDSFNSLTMQQYKKYIADGETVAQIAEYVGLSRSTLYRRVKAAESLGVPDDCNYITY